MGYGRIGVSCALASMVAAAALHSAAEEAGAYATRARPDGMARAMLGVAAVQALLTALAVTDPSTANDPRGIAGVLLLSGYFTVLWLASAALFHRSAQARSAAA